ncbi:MAG: GDP-fucose synthetase [Zetaproteobacteria bacterium CG06_land_8_20_14_3_00_59_53]|nr:MAG: GDP-fucose synthetase [Zetaproteobacteria bacterium CG2_30_59_37]PIO90302.1 MAG: GDP-fucose synthetase [Zetaproteobacteria bacterium CG23_combo_of_CG06-09_8_20_14_all_59_86]PIQ64930.1 MAG: GDP-fucose synthetase [Zetaproteobacteria bacterium CG11_big_fil_rev_8_21_14_0_20_59_439]PIU69590.1 MAG: GDP-fucose synthetase [Zetaproteobacteria bacterium CG06_land_8_20_14_3_00_59_53]PIU95923.1 MAG: GDP-fucose synthetase [Zetaproteobacteria bacterium CG03_land_8_20_14_0_80_59_51]PIY47121.1 MAG: GD
MQKDSRIHVAGHRGLVGSALVRCLQGQGYNHLLLRSSSELDLCDQQAVEAFYAAERPEYVILAAAKVGGIHANNSYPADFIRENLQIALHVIDAAYRHGAKKLLFLGSSCIYPKMAPQPIREEYLLEGGLEPTNEWYAIAKIAGLKMCQAYRRQYGFDAISTMPTNLYGPNDNYNLQNSHVLPALIRKFHLARLAAAGDVAGMQRDEQVYGTIPDDILHMLAVLRTGESLAIDASRKPAVMLWGSGSPCREFLYVDDLARACLFLLQEYSGEMALNVGVGEDITIKQLAGIIQGIVGFEGEVVWDANKPDGTPRKLLDVGRIHALGWKAQTGLEAGIRLAYQDYLSRF